MDLSCLGQTGRGQDCAAAEDGASSAFAALQNNDGPASGVEQQSTTPQLAYQSGSTAIYRIGDRGIKVLVDPNPSQDDTLKLLHEQNISNALPPNVRKRHVLDVKGFKGDPAIYFKWTEGQTLAEWLGKARRRHDVDLGVRLQVAIAIVETLREFNASSVVYNNLSPQNIVLDKSEGSYVATFIDLSEAVVYYNRDEEFAIRVREMDLKPLGTLLNELFCTSSIAEGDKDEGGSDYVAGGKEEERKEEPSTRKRGKQQALGEGLPMYLGTLISTLLLSGETDAASSYDSAKDVLFDLRVVETNPQAFLKPLVMDDHLVRGQLQLPEDCFYGRQSEISMLLHALNSVTQLGGQPMFVSISGSPGTGKSSLVQQIKRPLQNANGHFIQGKFDARSQSDAAIFSALESFYLDIMRQGREGVQRDIRSRVLGSIGGAGCKVLGKSIRSLQAFVGGEDESDDSFGMVVAEHRWKYLLCKLVAATAGESCPLVIALDDLQWADDESLDALRLIATDPDIKHCLFVGIHRDNQASSTTRLKELLQGMQEQGVSLMSMRLGPIEKADVNRMLSEVMCLPPRLTQQLSTIIYNKTGGIVLFVCRFLMSLNQEGLLWFNLNTRRWEYDPRGIEAKEISGDVVAHMAERMTRLPHAMQSGLKLAACLGSTFDAATLEKGTPENDIDITEFLRFAVEGGYLRLLSPNKYSWAHDQIHEAAFALIPESKRESFHLLLGSRIFLRTTPEELEGDDLFTIVGNMNIGIRLIKSQEQKLEVARLNLRAGEQAMKASSFNSAAKYLTLGVTLLPETSWSDDYALSLRLHDAAAEALYVTGDFDSLTTIVQTPLLHARCFEDKLNSYNFIVRYFNAAGKHAEGLAKSRSVLSSLGEPLPEHIDNNVYASEVVAVKGLLANLSEDDLLGLPRMTDERKLACMQFLNHSVSSAYCVEPLLAPILVFRMMKLSVQFGVCSISPFAFGLYGAWLVSALNSDFDGGYRMGRLAITLMNRLDAKEFIPRVYTSVYCFINIWKEPFQVALSKYLEGYDAGALSGDMEYAVSGLFQYSAVALNCCGEDLALLQKNIRLYIRRAIQCKQMLVAKPLVVLHAQILELVGSKESAYSPYLVDTDEDAMYRESLQLGEVSTCRLILYKRKFVAFYYSDMDAAAEYHTQQTKFSFGVNARQSHGLIGVFIDGLIAFHFARKRKNDERRWQKIGEAVVALVKNWSLNSEWNFANKLYLLEAEQFFYQNDEARALERYHHSIKSAHDHHFVQEEGLAFERAARFHLHYGRSGEALVCLTQAKKCYSQWGAVGLVQHIEKTILQVI